MRTHVWYRNRITEANIQNEILPGKHGSDCLKKKTEVYGERWSIFVNV